MRKHTRAHLAIDMGANGAEMLLDCANTLHDPTGFERFKKKWEVHKDGMSVSWPLAFGGAFQPHLTGLDNLKFICRIHGVDYKPLVSFVEDFTELGIYFREPVMHYSNGMTTRLAFALSMAIEFDCFLIDEAMVVGDARFHERCHVELFQKRKDRAFILVTHDANSIKTYCENACVLHEGKLIPFPTVDAAYEFYMNIEHTSPVLAEA